MKKVFAAIVLLSACVSCSGAAAFNLDDPGTDKFVDYEKYGSFEAIGTSDYKYVVKDSIGLKAAVGEGIYPNMQSIYKDPEFKKFKAEKKLEGKHWDFINTDDSQSNFYKWAIAQEEPGAKLFYTALALEKAGLWGHAVKAYYAIVVHFPRSVGYTYWNTPWYIGPVAIDKINYIAREHPELKIRLADAYVKVKNRFDDNLKNDVFTINPGKIVSATKEEIQNPPSVDVSKLPIVSQTGGDKVNLVKYSNGHWQLLVDSHPYVIKGMVYSPNLIPLAPFYPTPEGRTLNVSKDWQYEDVNKNGIIDGPYEAWVDKNKNEIQDKDEPAIGDFQLMKDMGVNTLRLYDHDGFNKQLLKDGYEKYGFMYVIGDPIGMYCIGSGADWYKGTDYTDEQQQLNMLERVRKMVEDYKDEPYILMWVLGNENNYAEPGIPGKDQGQGCQAKHQPDAYYKFINRAAKFIRELDPHKRPITICNGDTLFLDQCAANAPDIDAFGCNAYRGEQGFGSLYSDVAETYGKPVVVTEWGCSAFHSKWDLKKAEVGQAQYLIGNWKNMQENFAGRGQGNALGGFLFEWSDEWWKGGPATDPSKHDIVSQFGMPFLDGFSYEEWLGVCSVGDGKNSPFKRQLRLSYYELQKLWKK